MSTNKNVSHACMCMCMCSNGKRVTPPTAEEGIRLLMWNTEYRRQWLETLLRKRTSPSSPCAFICCSHTAYSSHGQ
uniref:Uncharacterized protein n=1 Tax=Globisporangium ultimum (strain ATCC 200006 / CBS 805.95 / DAOM BR144) TaxID=431595 RepID=K3WUS8_GLOUD